MGMSVHEVNKMSQDDLCKLKIFIERYGAKVVLEEVSQYLTAREPENKKMLVNSQKLLNLAHEI
jgi:hypothetical protein